MNQSVKVAVVSVNRSGAANAPVSVQYETSDGSGAAGSLYTPIKGTLQWDANDTSAKNIVVPVNGSAPFTGMRSFKVALSNPSADVALSTPSSATVTVAGDGAATLQFAATTYTVAQNNGAMTVTVARSGIATNAVSVAYATINGTATAGTNYTSTTGALQWAANDNNSKTFSIPIGASPTLSKNVGFNIALSAPGGGAVLGAAATAAVTLTPPVKASASGSNADKVLSYLSGLNKGSSHRVLSGQHADIWTSDLSSTSQPMEVINPLLGKTGENPSILGLVLNYATNSYAYTVSVTNTLANQWWSKGGMVMLSLYDNDPTFSFNSSGAPTGKPIPSSAFHELTNKSSAAYKQWHSQLDTYAAALHTLTDSGNVILFRPFIEINGDWNWYGAENTADFIAVWQDMHDYLMNTKGLTNVLWIYNVNQNVGHYMDYYPGADYVDIVGMDIYTYGSNVVSSANDGNMYSSLVATGKPVILPEVGLTPPTNAPSDYTVDNNALINAIQSSLPNVVGFLMFNGGWSICNQNNASSFLNNPWIVNMSELPAGI